jgi:DNA-binding transcriptional ArsR family regulator
MATGKPPNRSKDGRRTTPQAERRTLDDLKQVRALADPLRMRIVTALCEERTTKQVAELLHEKPTRLYHHVDALERAGLVQLTRTQPKRGTIEKYYRSVARTFEARVSTESGSEASREIDDVMATAFATTSAEVSRLLERGTGSTVSGSTVNEEAILSFLEVRATRAEIQKLRRRLHAAIGAAREEGKPARRDQRYRLTIAFYPLEAGGADATLPPPAKKRGAR